MKFPIKFALPLTLACGLSAAVPANTPRQANPIRITSISASGSGCPAGTFTADISPDNVTATLGFNEYQTYVGPGIPGSDRERNCDVFFTLRYPIGCFSAVFNIKYHGFAQIENTVSGTLSASYSLSPGSVSPSSPATSISGPFWVMDRSTTGKNLSQAGLLFATRTNAT
jgi:hypothetical protein